MKMTSNLRPALVLLGLFTLTTGVVYPLAVTGTAQLAYPEPASGSLIERNGQLVGSRLVGQYFDDMKYFWGRPSDTAPMAYNASSSTGSNLGPTNPALLSGVDQRVAHLRATHPEGAAASVPVDLVTASASGLDPHVSPAAALYQVPRVARERGLAEPRVRALVQEHIEGRTLGFLGEPRVNVLLLNVALDELTGSGA
jgi:K+-transporting ATPase ATPase C chain